MSKESLILLEENSSSRRYLNEKFKEKHITLTPQIEIAAHQLLLQFASIHLGVSCVVKEFSADSLLRGAVREMPLNPPLPPRNIGYAYLRHSTLSLAAQAFLQLIEKPL